MSYAVHCLDCGWHGRRKDFSRGCPECRRVPLVPRQSEAEFQSQVIGLAKRCGWLVCHFRPARTLRGWRTPVEGDAGFLDTVMTRRGRLIIAELKSDGGELTAGQRLWLEALRDVPGVEVAIWRPSDWGQIVAALSR